MTRKTIYFTAPGRVEIREESLEALAEDQVLVETCVSAISAGTEMLIYRGQFPRDLPDSRDGFSTNLSFPVAYGYASVGRVTEIGGSVGKDWQDRMVFAFQPHTSRFTAKTQSLFPIPADMDLETAVFLPNMETAVNLVQDAAPILGECALVLGQGVVGLLVAELLQDFPLSQLVTVDKFQLRRHASIDIGVGDSLDPTGPDWYRIALQRTPHGGDGFDLTLELTGNPAALDDAIALTRFSGRIVVGSWFGEKRAVVDLGGTFHRSRLKLISSQVSSIAPELSARWDKARRFDVAWNALGRIRPEKWITHRFPIANAAEAYRLLDESPEQSIQVLINYA